ncbi:hypothetical protein M422DRAFT_270783 [Sphaerobolus stellatus SS14]|uniref:cystathionine gamma-lyase n=1 Tax=Sphaerobolus stellatus (strain SS14) TaxID=990650 RepID=A0A0C9U1S8_SPHS4|nr:hypothetical protein M422DRAFT_270783 [Sphaerobolus stellatus SS14]
MDQQDGGGMQRRWANLKTVDEAAASDVDSELRPPLMLLQPRSTDLTSRISLLGPSCFDSLSTPCIWMSSLRPNHDVLERMIPGLETTGEKVSAFASGTNLNRNPHIHHPPPFPIRTHNLPNLLFPRRLRPSIIIESTFLSPFYVSPLAALISADLAIHSITKYINKHSDVLMGAVILPNASTAEANGNKATIVALYTRLQFLQNGDGDVLGACDAWLALREAKTLSLRMKEYGRSAIKLAQFLFAHPLVKNIIYPDLAEHPGHNNAAKILAPHKFIDEWALADEMKGDDTRKDKGDLPFGGMVSFRIGRAGALADDGATERFLTRTRLFTLAKSLGGVKSLAECRRRWRTGSSHRLNVSGSVSHPTLFG